MDNPFNPFNVPKPKAKGRQQRLSRKPLRTKARRQRKPYDPLTGVLVHMMDTPPPPPKRTFHAIKIKRRANVYDLADCIAWNPKAIAAAVDSLCMSSPYILHAVERMVDMVFQAQCYQYAELWSIDNPDVKQGVISLDMYFVIGDCDEQARKDRRSFQKLGYVSQIGVYKLPREDVVGAAFQINSQVRKKADAKSFALDDIRMLLMERAGIKRAWALPLPINGKPWYVVAFYDTKNERFAPSEGSVFVDKVAGGIGARFSGSKEFRGTSSTSSTSGWQWK